MERERVYESEWVNIWNEHTTSTTFSSLLQCLPAIEFKKKFFIRVFYYYYIFVFFFLRFRSQLFFLTMDSWLSDRWHNRKCVHIKCNCRQYSTFSVGIIFASIHVSFSFIHLTGNKNNYGQKKIRILN